MYQEIVVSGGFPVHCRGIDMAFASKLYATKILFICLKCINNNQIKMHV